MPTFAEGTSKEGRKMETQSEAVEMRGKVRVCDVCEAPEMFEEKLVDSIKEGEDLEEH